MGGTLRRYLTTIRWPGPPCDDDEITDAVRLYEQMWSIERIGQLLDIDHDALRRLIARHTRLRRSDRPGLSDRWW